MALGKYLKFLIEKTIVACDDSRTEFSKLVQDFKTALENDAKPSINNNSLNHDIYSIDNWLSWLICTLSESMRTAKIHLKNNELEKFQKRVSQIKADFFTKDLPMVRHFVWEKAHYMPHIFTGVTGGETTLQNYKSKNASLVVINFLEEKNFSKVKTYFDILLFICKSLTDE